ncbi:MAG: pilus assembly protein TadG-related protein [Marmoricola sp.]
MRRRLREAESGAMAIVVALVTCFVIVPLGALAVDLGMQRVSRVDAQAVADTTALDMARLLASGGSVTNAAATAAAARSAGAVGNSMTVNVYLGTLSSTYVSNQSLGCNGNPNNAYFTQSSSNPTAVLVTVSNVVNFSIHGGSGGVCRSSIAKATQRACVMIDSYAAALSSGDSVVLGPLNQMLGTNIDTTVLGSSGILTANLNVLDFLNVLKTNLSLGSTDQVLGANVTAAQVVAAEVTALQPPYNTLTAAATALSQQIGAHIASSATFKVSDLLNITQGGASALSGTVNPLDLAAAGVQLANGTNALAISASSSNLTGLSASATVGSRPTQTCLGDAKPGVVSQTSISATANINAPGSLTSAVGSLVSGLSGLLNGVLGTLGALLGGDTYDVPGVTLGQISANVSLASATGKVTGLSCSGATPTGISVLEQSSLLPATISIPVIVSETRHYGGVLGVGRKSETVTSTMTVNISTVPQADQSVTDTLSLPTNYDTAKAGPSGNLSVNNLNVSVALTMDGSFSNGYPLVNKLLSSATSVISQIQSTIVSQLESAVVTPLFTSLTSTLKSLVGTTIAGSSYRALRTAICNTPKLAG